MARKVRIEYAGAIYHVMSRGDKRGNIFKDDRDRLRFIETLGECCGKAGWHIHAYVLMPNHFHLIVETPQPNLVAGMKWLMGTYTGRFNRRHQLIGHVFAGRYKALVVDGDSHDYLRTVCSYVHLNPARARLISKQTPLRSFPWSSWPDYLALPPKRPVWLRTDRYLGEWGIPNDNAAGRRRLEHAVEELRADEDQDAYKPIRRGWCLGDDSFRKDLLIRVEHKLGPEHYGPERHETQVDTAERIIREEMKRRHLTEDRLEKSPKGDRQKLEIARRLRTETVMTVAWIAQRLHLGSRAYATQLLWRHSTSKH